MPHNARKISLSKALLSQIAMPEDANPHGRIHGGTIMKLIDNSAAVVAMRHTSCKVITASVDKLDFLQPIVVGDLIILKASLNHVGRTSMEIGIKVEAENLLTGDIRHAASAYLTLVALDADGLPTPAPQIICETAEDERRLAAAARRYAEKKARNRAER